MLHSRYIFVEPKGLDGLRWEPIETPKTQRFLPLAIGSSSFPSVQLMPVSTPFETAA